MYIFRSEASIRSYSSRLSEGKKRHIAEALGKQLPQPEASSEVALPQPGPQPGPGQLALRQPRPGQLALPQPGPQPGPSQLALRQPGPGQLALPQPGPSRKVTPSSLLKAMSSDPWDSEVDDEVLVSCGNNVLMQESSSSKMDQIFAPVFNNCNNVTINFGVPQ